MAPREDDPVQDRVFPPAHCRLAVSWRGHSAHSKPDLTTNLGAELYLLSDGRFASDINNFQPRSFRAMVSHPPGSIRPKWDDNKDSIYSDVPSALRGIITKCGPREASELEGSE